VRSPKHTLAPLRTTPSATAGNSILFWMGRPATRNVAIRFMNEKGKEAEFQKKAEQIRDEMKQQTPTIKKLFEPAE
jgi:hypothetical protein